MFRLNVGNRLDKLRASRWAKPVGLVWLITCMLAGGYCFTRQSADATTSTSPKQITKVIETIRVGERVVTPQTVPGVSLPTAVDPATWRLVSLQMETRYAGGMVDTMRVQTLQPPSWMSEHQVRVGARVPIPLDLKEMGVQDQLAEVTGISACPPIETGPGRVVLTTVNHLNNFLFDLSMQGPRSPPSLITVTGWHKLYSEDRAAWVSVCELKAGENLRGRNGTLTVAGLIRHEGTETVYNMTVEGEHQYYVADAELLAHNAGCFDPNDLPARGGPKDGSLAKDDGAGNGQIRDYDSDGNAKRDYDFGHDHGAGDPHMHDWKWSPPKYPGGKPIGTRGPGLPL